MKSAVTAAASHEYEVESPAARSPTVRSQAGASGSVTVTLIRSASPMLVTVIVNVASSPERTCWVSGVFWMSMAGSITATSAVSESVTDPPAAWSPLTDAMLVNPAVTLAREQM